MIDIFTTGGTIDKVYFDALSEYQIGPTTLPDILRENGVFAAHRITQLMRKDSLDLTNDDRALIHAAVAASDAIQILVTHGTDTMVQTAARLADISDAAFNVGFALAAVQTLPHGVYIAMNGQIFDPAKAAKDRAGQQFVTLA
jgi:L-asparaginase